MSFLFGGDPNAPKTPLGGGFNLPTSTTVTASVAPAAAGGFTLSQAGSGDSKPASTLFSTPFKLPAATAAVQPTPGLAFNLPKTTAPTLSFAPATPAASAAPATLTFGLGSTPATAPSTTTSGGLQFGFGGAQSSPAITTTSTTTFTPILGTTTAAASSSLPSTTTTALTFAASTATAATKPLLGATTSGTTTGFSLGGTATAKPSLVAPQQPTSTTSSLSFAQLEDSINKWTIDLEEQGKFFINQAKQLNAWDTLLISNGEKILNLNGSIERVKQQQTQLDQELDFILAQQKELEELIVPLEKELVDIPVTDVDRNQMYQFSEIIDSQLKQISDDLKEIIENINESNKDDEVSNPITQISKILNAHMNSLQWIDTNTAQISRKLEEISKIEDSNRRNLNLNSSINMFQ